jgi:6-phosphogluconolactonase/glucosamine-6-phosphate isomerase/deaminase
VEKEFLARSGLPWEYPGETMPALEVDNIYSLGQIVSQRFMEWVIENPTGVVALPTGRTPEFFIKTLEKYKLHWDSDEVSDEIRHCNIVDFPDTSKLKFVMLDEFFPMASSHRNSFCRYIQKYYVSLLGILPENVLSFDLVSEGIVTPEELASFEDPDIDLTLLDREPVNAAESNHKKILTKVAGYCEQYEARVKAWGGIGFFLGGIGPDGHIAFNQEGQPLDSRTRLVKFNYPSAAVAAGDLGGIEIARGKAAVTIGLSTITANPEATIIIMAAGEGKASVVRAALEESRDPARPSTAFIGHKGIRFYLTHGAACKLTARQAKRIHDSSAQEALEWAISHLSGCSCHGGTQPAIVANPPESYRVLESYLYEQSVRVGTPVHELTPEALSCQQNTIACPQALLDNLTCRALVACAARRLREKVECGLRSFRSQGLSILHTAPHHDDIMLSYHGKARAHTAFYVQLTLTSIYRCHARYAW